MSLAGSDRIELRGLRITAHVGVSAAERAIAQPLEIDADIEANLHPAAASDRVEDTIDYGVTAIAIAEEIGRTEHHLLERVARVAAQAVFDADPRAVAITLTVRKLRPPVPVDITSTGVTVRFEQP